MARGMLTIQQLHARCIVDKATHCWLWQGATSPRGLQPRLWTFDHAAGEKRGMSGPLAAWNIAFQAAPRPGCLVFRCCMRSLCLNPAHLREAIDRKFIGRHIRRAGTRKGVAVESRCANLVKAREAQGMRVTPPEVVRAIRARGPGPTNVALGLEFGLSHRTVSRIRRRDSHRHVVGGSE